MQHIHIYPGAAKSYQAQAAGIYLENGSGAGGYGQDGDAGRTALAEALDESLPEALESHLPDALENHIGDAIDAHLGDAIESAVQDSVPRAVEDATSGLSEEIAEEVSNVIKPLLSHLKRTTNQARNRKRQTRGVSDLMPMPDKDGHTRPRNNQTISRTIRTVAEVNALTEPQARAWLKFLDEPVPTLSGTPAAKLATLRQAVLDGFRGE